MTRRTTTTKRTKQEKNYYVNDERKAIFIRNGAATPTVAAKYPNVYKGEFKNDQAHGQGEMKFENGNVFIGRWKYGEPERGTFSMSNGDVYIGDMVDYQFFGRGEMRGQTGNWKNGNFVQEEQQRRLFSTVATYRDDAKIKSALKGCAILDFAEFSEWFMQSNLRFSDRRRRDLTSLESYQEMSYDKLYDIATDICQDIEVDYGRQSVRKTKNSSDLDGVFILAPDHDKLKRDEFSTRPEVSLKKKLKHILGFLIVEKGECRKDGYENVYAVNLICTRNQNNLEYKLYDKRRQRERIRGAILLGAYLHCLKGAGEKMGILELAHGYENLEGFFSYSKMGFVRRDDLKCFTNFMQNLPMSVDLDQFTSESIINYASGVEKLSRFQDETGLLQCVPKTKEEQKKQKIIATFCNIEYILSQMSEAESWSAVFDQLDMKAQTFLVDAISKQLGSTAAHGLRKMRFESGISLHQAIDIVKSHRQGLVRNFHRTLPMGAENSVAFDNTRRSSQRLKKT